MRKLLIEALDHITAKPWDDRTLLHARISHAVGEKVHYKDHIRKCHMEHDQYHDAARDFCVELFGEPDAME